MESLLYIGIYQSLFTMLFLLFKNSKASSDYIIVFWMPLLVLPMLLRLFSPENLNISLWGLDSINCYPATYGPLLWLYTRSLTNEVQTLSFRDLVHSLPFVILALLQILAPEKNQIPSLDGVSIDAFYLPNVILSDIPLFCYSLATLWHLVKHQRNMLNHYSYLSNMITLKWLQVLTIGFILSFLIPIFAPVLQLPSLLHTHGFTFVSLILMLSFFSMKQPRLLFPQSELQNFDPSDVPTSEYFDTSVAPSQEALIQLESNPATLKHETKEKVSDDQNQSEKYKNSGLNQQQSHRYLQRIVTHMNDNKSYLDANLTLDKLSNQLKMPRHYLTQVLNEQLDKNFHQFINEYRINTVKEWMMSQGGQEMTLLDIAYESGFNSKSTFNTVFKRLTEMTPSQYRKKLD
ncbi:MAG: AraC-like DNA-binding protein [Psychromonas sp.]|jgi:AraC-like DNA-binding protein|uniref:helix-turn-helix domain-containing protein n=1 Tax=Psychromonas sp. TaxID=1884585 RepID=UPI0039E39E6F